MKPELVVVSGKGGTGKTLLASSVLITASRKRVDVLGVDADAETPNLHILLGGVEWVEVEEIKAGKVARIDYNLCTGCLACLNACSFDAIEVIDSKPVVNELACEGCRACALVCPTGAVRVQDVVAGYVKLGFAKDIGVYLVTAESIPGRPNSGKIVTEARLKARMRNEKHVVIDAPAGIGCPVIASLTGATIVLFVVEPTPTSISDFKRVLKIAKYFGLSPAMVINKADISERYRKLIEDIACKEGIPVIGHIPFEKSIAEAVAKGVNPLLTGVGGKAVEKLSEVAEFIVEEILVRWCKWVSRYKLEREYLEPLIVKTSDKDVNRG